MSSEMGKPYDSRRFPPAMTVCPLQTSDTIPRTWTRATTRRVTAQGAQGKLLDQDLESETLFSLMPRWDYEPLHNVRFTTLVTIAYSPI